MNVDLRALCERLNQRCNIDHQVCNPTHLRRALFLRRISDKSERKAGVAGGAVLLVPFSGGSCRSWNDLELSFEAEVWMDLTGGY